MKRLVMSALLALCAFPALAHGNERGLAKATVAGKEISIDYGRPSLKGRDMLGKAEAGQVWRMGADAPTKLTTKAALKFGAASIPAGEYVLTARKEASGGWTLRFEKPDRAVQAEVPLVASEVPESVETLAIELKGEKSDGTFRMTWGKTALQADFTAK